MVTVQELCDDSDWGYVFGENIGASNTNDADVVGDCPAEPPVRREDVDEIIAIRDGENDGDDWMGVFRMLDGRYLYATGGCDYTGWG